MLPKKCGTVLFQFAAASIGFSSFLVSSIVSFVMTSSTTAGTYSISAMISS